MSLLSTILTAVASRIEHGKSITSASDPSIATCTQWANETALWITGICAENNSDLGRVTGSFTTIHAHLSAATKASPCAITTSAAHGLVNDDEIVIKDAGGMTELNDTEYTFTKTAAATGTLGIDSSAYTTYTSGGYITKRKYNDFAATLYAPAQEGWILNGRQRDPLILRAEDKLKEYDPAEAAEPAEFYVDGSNNIGFFVYPDDAYTVKIPYWQLPTAMTDGGSTVPFLGLMDNVFIEAIAHRYFNRNEYDLSFDLKWQSFLLERVKRVIELRKKMAPGISK